MIATPKFKGIRKLESTNFRKQKKTTQTFLLLMEEILHQLIGTLSHVLQGFIHPNGGWPWDFWTINSRERFFTTINMNHPTLKLVWPTEILSLLGVLPLNSLSKKKNWKKKKLQSCRFGSQMLLFEWFFYCKCKQPLQRDFDTKTNSWGCNTKFALTLV